MNRRTIVIATAAVAAGLFAGGAYYQRMTYVAPAPVAPSAGDSLIRPHSPTIGPVDARVAIVEFFDPSCEACRAFYPIVKQIMTEFPQQTRLILRYAPLHEGSEEAVTILESARLQGKFIPVLEALLGDQPSWAVHGAPDLERAWRTAAQAGLDLERARKDAQSPEIKRILEQDVADMKKAGIQGTPTFFVNGKPLPSFGSRQLYELVLSEVAATKKN